VRTTTVPGEANGMGAGAGTPWRGGAERESLCGKGEECVVASWEEGGLVTEDLCVLRGSA